MAAKIFDDLLLTGIRRGQIPARTSTARQWFRKKARGLGKVSESDILNHDKDRLKKRITVGSMYFFAYDAKHKATLPYYDRFPLIFPVDKAPGGFYGCNLHYLPPTLRAQLMDALYEVTSNDKFNDTTKLKISYSILKDAERFSLFKPTFKRYLTSHMRSPLVKIHSTEWDIALFLGAEKFVGASNAKVWADSRKTIKG